MASPKKRAPRDERLLFDELAALYREADALHAGHSCPGTTECCRFHITGREPYVTTVEVALLRRAIAARGGDLSQKRRALPLIADEGTCPLLTVERKCAVYADRPLGCRTYWCDRASADHRVRQPALNELVRKIRELAERHAPHAVQGRPLRRALADTAR